LIGFFDKSKNLNTLIDVISVLTGSSRPRKYWDDLKRKLKAEGSQLSENIGQLKLPKMPENRSKNEEVKLSAAKMPNNLEQKK
jgi:hypothetical protein